MSYRHGTLSGYGYHRKNKTLVCDPCQEARRIYDHERWKAREDVRKAARKRADAHWKMQRDLRETYPNEYGEYLDNRKAQKDTYDTYAKMRYAAIKDLIYAHWNESRELYEGHKERI